MRYSRREFGVCPRCKKVIPAGYSQCPKCYSTVQRDFWGEKKGKKK